MITSKQIKESVDKVYKRLFMAEVEHNNFMQVLETTDEEKFLLYDKLPKEQLIKMLINCNKIRDAMPKVIFNETHNYCNCDHPLSTLICGKNVCLQCKKPIY